MRDEKRKIREPEEMMSPRTREVFERGQNARDTGWYIRQVVQDFVDELKTEFPDNLKEVRKQIYGAYQSLLHESVESERKERERRAEEESEEPKSRPGTNGVNRGVPEDNDPNTRR